MVRFHALLLAIADGDGSALRVDQRDGASSWEFPIEIPIGISHTNSSPPRWPAEPMTLLELSLPSPQELAIWMGRAIGPREACKNCDRPVSAIDRGHAAAGAAANAPGNAATAGGAADRAVSKTRPPSRARSRRATGPLRRRDGRHRLARSPHVLQLRQPARRLRGQRDRASLVRDRRGPGLSKSIAAERGRSTLPMQRERRARCGAREFGAKPRGAKRHTAAIRYIG
jgi:hypothetical protein